ncbi:hypothetical protein M5362_06075 [Streptomyces sp. Je 1-79]|uniref:hypothetical protein n=1 Tax=Streptomyces sp. Je 1-79 TaxID=2943847 RepID=UPI0021A49CC4|nr:hypothetical protein [Streptomyces sp. Je 1-79]MCT4352699.1 hypothetical protein [Streptomyces sp. Je 1-79]
MSDSLLPYAVGAAKRARRAAVRMRRRVEQLHTVPAIGGGIRPSAQLKPVHFSVSNGRTLNFAVAVPGRRVASAELVLSHGTSRERVPLELEPQADGTALLTATVPLRHKDRPEPVVRGPVLGSGIWRLAVLITDLDGQTRRTTVAAATGRDLSDGPTLPFSPSPTSGATFRIVRSVDGFALLKVRAPRPHAELTSFDLRWDRVTVHGRLIGSAQTSGTAEAVLRRGNHKAVTVTPEWDGDRFTFDVPLDKMGAGRGAARTWDLYLRLGGTRLKIARRLTDVRHPRLVYRTPFRIVALDNGSLMRVHAHVTAAGALAVNCADVIAAHPSTEEVA